MYCSLLIVIYCWRTFEFQFLVIMNRAVVNIHIQFLCEHRFYFTGVSRREIAGSYGMCMFTRVVKVLVSQLCLTL